MDLESNTTEEKEGPWFTQGNGTLAIPMSLHAANRANLIDSMNARLSSITSSSTKSSSKPKLVVMQGGASSYRHSSDHEPLFRQESNFHYLFGVKEPDCYGAIDLVNKKSYLFVPRLPPSYAIWMGEIQPPSHFKKIYGVDACYYVDEIEAKLKELGVELIYTHRGLNTDSGNYSVPANFKGKESFREDKDVLALALDECRVIKSDAELEVMRCDGTVSDHVGGVIFCSSLFCYVVNEALEIAGTCRR